MNGPCVSAEGAKEYSPERSAAELRDFTPVWSNPCQGVTEIAACRMRRRFDDGGAFRRPISRALLFLFDKPGVPLRFTPGFNPSHPAGALSNCRPT